MKKCCICGITASWPMTGWYGAMNSERIILYYCPEHRPKNDNNDDN